MTEMNRIESVASEAAILVGVLLPHHEIHGEPLDELEGLATTAGSRIVGQLTQRRQAPDVTTYLGKGKVDELKQMAAAADADVIIFDNDLSPAQTRNLEEATSVKVLDRSELILDIFASRAQTFEARLAVELAQLQYSLPRLKQMWTHLSRLKMGIGMRGPGEKQLEVDRRLVEKRIADLRHELKVIEQRKEREVAARSDRMTVSLVGYTNAGKSTLLNALTGADVLTENKLFATLDTRTRRWQLPGWGPGAAERHGRLHSRPAASFDRQLQGHARRVAAGRPAAARGRRQQPGRVGPDRGRLQGAGRAGHPGQGHAAGAQ